MAKENNEDDTWLYGNANNDNQSDEQAKHSGESDSAENSQNDNNDEAAEQNFGNNEEQHPAFDADETDRAGDEANENIEDDIRNGNAKGDDAFNGVDEVIQRKDQERGDESDDGDDDDDDDIVVTIRDIQPATNFNIKQRGGHLLATANATAQDKPKINLGKFSIDEFESVGTISGQLAIEYNIEAIEDKPWRKPGADITDYFNYGFSEETWRAYCERQKKMRQHESGVGLADLGGSNAQQITQSNSNPNRIRTSLSTTENSKYSSSGSTNSHAGPPIYSNRGGYGPPPDSPAKENAIQVMTAERREYSRPKIKFDGSMNMSMPPPPFNMPIPMPMPMPMPNEPFYPEDNYSYGYEPTQEQQWNNDNVGWIPSGIKELTPGPPPHMNMNMPPPRTDFPRNQDPMMPPNMINVPQIVQPPPYHNMNMGPPHGQMSMMPPSSHIHLGPPIGIGIGVGNLSGIGVSRDRNERCNDRGNLNDFRAEYEDKRNQSSSSWRMQDKEREYREQSRERNDPGESEEMERQSRVRDEESPSRDRERRRDRDRYRERDRDRDRDRGSSRRGRSRSRERSERKRRSKSRESTHDKHRKLRNKKKSHKKDKDKDDSE